MHILSHSTPDLLCLKLWRWGVQQSVSLQVVLVPVGVCKTPWELFKEGQALCLCARSHLFSATLEHLDSQLVSPVSGLFLPFCWSMLDSIQTCCYFSGLCFSPRFLFCPLQQTSCGEFFYLQLLFILPKATSARLLSPPLQQTCSSPVTSYQLPCRLL